MRDFMEERRRQLVDEELERTIERVFPSNTEEGRMIRAIYSQNPLLNFLLNRARRAKPGRSPYTQPVVRKLESKSGTECVPGNVNG